MGMAAECVLDEITSYNGASAVIVGGCVRDIIMGVEPHDFDIATNMSIKVLEEVFGPVHDIGRSKDFGIVTINYGDYSFEVAQYRVDGVCDGRHPESVTVVDNLREDVLRRDFTINGLAATETGIVIDYVGGIQDLDNHCIRAIGDPNVRFQEDYLRMLRACRFAARFAFDIHPQTLKAIQDNAHNIVHISPERIKDELFKVAGYGGEALVDFIELMGETGLLPYILPEIEKLKENKEEEKWHPEAYFLGDGTTYYHTLAAVLKSDSKDALTNLCVLFHDIGKGETHSFEDGRNRFRNHDNVGASIVGRIADRLKFSKEEKDAVVYCAKNHMKMTHVREMKKSKIFELVTNKHWGYLRTVVICDDSSRREAYNEEKLNEVLALAEDIAETFETKDSKPPKVVDGSVVMEILGIPPGKRVGEVINSVTDKFLNSENFVCLRQLIKEHK